VTNAVYISQLWFKQCPSISTHCRRNKSSFYCLIAYKHVQMCVYFLLHTKPQIKSAYKGTWANILLLHMNSITKIGKLAKLLKIRYPCQMGEAWSTHGGRMSWRWCQEVGAMSTISLWWVDWSSLTHCGHKKDQTMNWQVWKKNYSKTAEMSIQ